MNLLVGLPRKSPLECQPLATIVIRMTPIVSVSAASGKNTIRDGGKNRGCSSALIKDLRWEPSAVDLGNIRRGNQCFHELDNRGAITVSEV